MSRRQLKTDDEEGFLRAFRDEVLDLAAEYGVRLEFHLALPVTGSGVVIRGWAWELDWLGSERLVGTVDQPYPTHSALRLHAALYRAAIKLGGSIREHRRLTGREKDRSPAIEPAHTS